MSECPTNTYSLAQVGRTVAGGIAQARINSVWVSYGPGESIIHPEPRKCGFTSLGPARVRAWLLVILSGADRLPRERLSFPFLLFRLIEIHVLKFGKTTVGSRRIESGDSTYYSLRARRRISLPGSERFKADVRWEINFDSV